MPQNHTVNRRIVLNSRPVGAPTDANFRLDEAAVAVASKGQVVLRTLYLSLDPYMRGRMSDSASYAAPTALGEVMGEARFRALRPHYTPITKWATWC